MDVECELCANCKKEIPHNNYVMHTAHCARNITLCKVCKEPIPKNQFDDHAKACRPKVEKPKPPSLDIEKTEYYRKQKSIQDEKEAKRREEYLKRYDRFVDPGHNLKEKKTVANEAKENNVAGAAALPVLERTRPLPPNPKSSKSSLIPCKYCELELPKLDLEEHEGYCGARTDRCQECGELVMFKYKQLHEDSNHGFLKLSDEPGPRPTWESSVPRTNSESSIRRRRLSPLRSFSTNFDLPYIPPPPPSNAEKKETYREISRRLDCKTEYIRNLLHDSASITVPLRTNGAVPRNHFNHNKGPAPQPPRRNPPTELEIPCEFCGVPIPHEELIQHETGCRPDLARFNPRRRSPSPDDYFIAPQPSSPEVELPCEFCSDMIPASQLLRHQATCI